MSAKEMRKSVLLKSYRRFQPIFPYFCRSWITAWVKANVQTRGANACPEIHILQLISTSGIAMPSYQDQVFFNRRKSVLRPQLVPCSMGEQLHAAAIPGRLTSRTGFFCLHLLQVFLSSDKASLSPSCGRPPCIYTTAASSGNGLPLKRQHKTMANRRPPTSSFESSVVSS